MKQHLNRFLASLASDKGYSENTIAAYRNDLNQFLDFLRRWPGRPIAEPGAVAPAVVAAYVEFLQQHNKYVASTIARKVASVRSFFHALIGQGVISSDPTLRLEVPRVKKGTPKVLTHEEVKCLLAAPRRVNSAKSLRDRAILELLYGTGMRVSEAVALQVEAMDLERREVTLKGKDGRRRVVPIDGPTAATLREYLEKARPAFAKDSGQGPVFLNHRGRKLTRQGLWLIIKGYTQEAGIGPGVTPHTLRHSFAKHQLGRGVSVREVQGLLGHASLSTTLVYTQLGGAKAGGPDD